MEQNGCKLPPKWTIFASQLLLALHCRSLKHWDHGRMCSELWGLSRPYKPKQSADMAEVGWLGCEDGRIWREMGGPVGEAREVNEEKEGGGTTTTPNPGPFQAQTPQRKPRVAKPLGRERSGLSDSLLLCCVLCERGGWSNNFADSRALLAALVSQNAFTI